jgi:hypothetical protein
VISRFFSTVFTAVFLLSASGCGVKAVITGFSGAKTEVEKLKASGAGGTVSILDGDALRQVKLKNVDLITVLPTQTRMHNGGLYYQVRVMCKDGTKIGFDDKVNPESAAFISLDGVFVSKTRGGTYSISIDKVSELDVK